MTAKDLLTGKITIQAGAVRPDLEVTPIKAGVSAESAFIHLGNAIRSLRIAALKLPFETDASTKTLHSVCEAEEILMNLRVRLDFDPPTETAMQRIDKKKKKP